MNVGIATGFVNHAPIDDGQFLRKKIIQLGLATELGFESIWITEHHFSDCFLSSNPLAYLTYLAVRHPTVRLGTQALVVPWHDPVRLCEDIVLLNHLSGGGH